MPSASLSVLEKIQYISGKVSKARGPQLYQNMVLAIAEVIGCDYVFIASLDFDKQLSQTLALAAQGQIADNFSYELKHTPCEDVSQNNICVYTEHITEFFPKDQLLIDMGIEAYIGTPLFDSKGEVQALFVALHSQSITNKDEILLIFEIASVQISLEIERSIKEQQNYLLLNYDEKTGFLSKLALKAKLAASGEQSLLLLTINNFFMLNEAYGMDEADKILLAVADTIKEIVDAKYYASVGISTYALLFEGEQPLESYIDKVNDYFSHHEVKTDTLAIYLSFAFGGAIGDHDLLRIASTALKQSKTSDNKHPVIYNQEMVLENFSHRQRFIETSNIVYQAIEHNLVIPYFQGIYDNRLGKITRYEALARILYKGTVLTPYNFIDAAKLSGVLPKVTRIMIRKSCQIMSYYQAAFSINISEEDLSADYLLAYLNEQCLAFNIQPHRITLEVLEGIRSSGDIGHVAQIKALKQAGYKIAIDDFGAEYSNFERVLDLEVDFIKIDAKYIKHIDVDHKSYEVVKAIAFFCENTGIESIAEFVSSESIQKVVKSLGINYSQGYLYSIPEPMNSEVPEGSHELYFDDELDNLIWIKVQGHHRLNTGAPEKLVALMNQFPDKAPFNVIFDARESDFFQVGEQEIIEQAQSVKDSAIDMQVAKYALISNDSYSKYVTQLWCDNLSGSMMGKVCEDEQQAKAWFADSANYIFSI